MAGATVIHDDDQAVDGRQFHFALEHVGNGVLVVVHQAHFLVLSKNLGVHDEQAKLAGKLAQRCLLAVNQQARSYATGGSHDVGCQAAQLQDGVCGLDQQALAVHTPVLGGVTGYSLHGVSTGQFAYQLVGLPGFHAIHTDEGLLAAGDLDGGVVGGTVADQRCVGVRIQRVVETSGAHRAAVIQQGGHVGVGCQDTGSDDAVGEHGFLVHKRAIDFRVKREAAKSASRHRLSSSVNGVCSCSALGPQIGKERGVLGFEFHACHVVHHCKLFGCGVAARCSLGVVGFGHDNLAGSLPVVLRFFGSLGEPVRLGLSFQLVHGCADVSIQIGAAAQCRVLRQQVDYIIRIDRPRILRSVPGKIAEAVICGLLSKLGLQLLDLLECGCQVSRFLRTECGQALLGGVQLLLEGLLAAVCGCAVPACQCHDGVYLGFAQALDCSQIFTFHRFLPLGYGMFSVLPRRRPTRPIPLGVSDLEIIVPWFPEENVTTFFHAVRQPCQPWQPISYKTLTRGYTWAYPLFIYYLYFIVIFG
nr:MAG TPA: hypothetical protein [Caudoviricetes sp.]